MTRRERIKIFVTDAVITLLAFGAVYPVGGAVCRVIEKVRWAYQLIDQLDQLGPNINNLIPPPPNGGKNSAADLDKWIRQNLPRSGSAEYREVGTIFQATAAKLRAGELDGKREAYADTARELARTVDRATWTPFLAALTAREEAAAAEQNAELADLFDRVGKVIAGEAKFPADPAGEGVPVIG